MRYFLGDLLYVISRIPLAVARFFSGFWRALPLAARRRLVVAVGAIALVLVVMGLLVPNLPCSFPGGDECPAEDEAIALIPSDALLYAHIDLDPGSEQYQDAAEVAGRMPLVARQVAGRLLPLLIGTAGQPSDFGRDIDPWFGGEAAAALTGGPGTVSRQVQLLEVEDADGAREYAESIAAGTAEPVEYEGIEVTEDERGLASAIVEDFLVLGTGSGVRSVIDVATGAEGAAPLADDAVAKEALDELPDYRVAEAYVSQDGIAELIADPGSSLAAFEPLVAARSSRGAAAALTATDDGAELAVRSVLDPERSETRPGFFSAFGSFEPELPARLAPDTLAYLGFDRPSETIGALLDQATANAPAIASGFTGLIKDLRKAAGVNLERDLLPALQGEAAVAVAPRPAAEGASEPQGSLPGLEPPDTLGPGAGATPYLELIADEVDAEAARDALARLQKPLADALFDPALGAPSFESQEIAGTEAQVVRVSPTAQVIYAVVDSILVVANDPAAVERAAEDSGGLADSEGYEEAVEDLDDDPSLLAYLDLGGLLAFGEQSGLAEDPAYASFAVDLRKLDTLALAVRSGDDALDTDLRLAISRGEDEDAQTGGD